MSNLVQYSAYTSVMWLLELANTQNGLHSEGGDILCHFKDFNVAEKHVRHTIQTFLSGIFFILQPDGPTCDPESLCSVLLLLTKFLQKLM